MQTYRVTGARPVLDVEPGELLDAAFTAEEEAELVASGRVEIVAGEYVNLGTSVVYGAKPGESFKQALTVGQKQALVAGGHIDEPSVSADLSAKKRDELETLARSLGVGSPEKLANKQAVIDAIEAANQKEGE